MALYRSIRERMQDQSNGLIGRDEPEPVRPLLPPPAPAGIIDFRPGAIPVDPNLVPGQADTPQGEGDVLQRLYAGGNDPNLSPEDNERIKRYAMLISGLSTLANVDKGLPAIASGLAVGIQAGEQMRSQIKGELYQKQTQALRGRVSKAFENGPPDPDTMAGLMAEALVIGDTESIGFVQPFYAAESTRQQEEQAQLTESVGSATADRLIAAVNSGQISREEAFSQLSEARAQGDPAADIALDRLRSDSDQATLRRDRIRDDFQDEGKALEVRARSVASGLEGNPSDLELIASVMRAETGDTSISARNVTQFSEQGTRIGIAQEIWDALTKTSELTDPIRQQMRRRLRFLGSQVAREAEAYERRLIQAATAERVFVDDLGVKLPSELLPEIGPARTEAGQSRVSRMLDAAESLGGGQ